jgi:hypothetical protein
MSAPVAGKFQDHYAVLGIEPKSDSETVQRAYSRLAEKYHPNNSATGNKEKFEAVNLAYEVLSDPALRREFDALKGLDQDKGAPQFSGSLFFEALGRDGALRAALLCVLYDRRRTRPFTPSLSMRHLELLLDATTEELSFALWYLKQRSLVASDDKSSLQITVDGMDYLARNPPTPELVMPFIKAPSAAPAAEAAPVPPLPVSPLPAETKAAAGPAQPEPARSAFSRILARA